MGKSVFIKLVSEPRNDSLKSIIGISCAAQAIDDGHDDDRFNDDGTIDKRSYE